MKAKSIWCKKLINLGMYEHIEIGIELTVDEGERAQDVLDKAKLFIDANNPIYFLQQKPIFLLRKLD